MQWGVPYIPILAENHDRVADSLTRVPEFVKPHLLGGMVWRLDHYSAPEIIGLLQSAGEQHIAEAVQWLALVAARNEEMPLEPAVEFWREVLNAGFSPSTYYPFGWLVRVGRIDGDTWLDLLLPAAIAARGDLEQPVRIARRAAEHAGDERAIDLLTALLARNSKLWYLADIAEIALRLLQTDTPMTASARDRLRERLIEREFFEALERPTNDA